jgi:hypothetical protein
MFAIFFPDLECFQFDIVTFPCLLRRTQSLPLLCFPTDCVVWLLLVQIVSHPILREGGDVLTYDHRRI